MNFSAAVRLMRMVTGGETKVSDYYTTDRAPYRYAHVTVIAPSTLAPARAAELVALAVQIDGHLTVHTHYSTEEGAPACNITLSLSRDLEEGEYRPHGFVSLPVELEGA